ncbi:MAG: TlpA family protein disulfide reductase [Planctomycetes bacterium]|nr:TlpA family protein disulfide reductase [Planctomycetota bacterium]
MMRKMCFAALALASLGIGLGAQTPAEDFAKLKDLAGQLGGMRQAPPAEPEKRAELQKLSRELMNQTNQFAEKHLSGALNNELAKLLVEADGSPMLRSLIDKAVEHGFESGHAEAALASIDALVQAGLSADSQKRLGGARAIALFALGKDDAALKLAKDAAEAAGKGGLKSLDIAAAILAARGAYEEARALYEGYAKAHGGDERSAYQYESKRTMLGTPAPEIAIQTWIGPKGAEHKGFEGLAALKGKVAVLDFWQTWCGPCRAVMPGLSKAQERLERHGVQLLGLCWKDGRPGYDWAKQAPVAKEEIEGDKYPAHVAKFSADMGLAYVCGIAETRANSEAYKVQGIPTLVIVDAQGNVAWITIGSGLGVEALIETLCERLVKRGAVAR